MADVVCWASSKSSACDNLVLARLEYELRLVEDDRERVGMVEDSSAMSIDARFSNCVAFCSKSFRVAPSLPVVERHCR